MNDASHPSKPAFPQPVSGTVVPRFGDIATFMRLPLFRDPGRRRDRHGRRAVGRRHDQPPGRPPRPAPDARPLDHDAPRPPRHRRGALRAGQVRRPRRRAGQSGQPRRFAGAHRSTSSPSCTAAGAVPLVGRRRPSDHAADHARHRARACRRSAWCISTPTATPGTPISAATSTPTARRSAAPSRRGCSIPSAWSRSASAARSTSATTTCGRSSRACG